MTSENRKNRGLKGEEEAASYLSSQGYEILARRFRRGRGEVDIIAREGDEIVFVEVKAWRSLAMSNLEHSLNARKQSRILHAALTFLSEGLFRIDETKFRFDLVFVGESGLRHIRSAWYLDGVV